VHRKCTAVHRASALSPATSGLITSYERLGYMYGAISI